MHGNRRTSKGGARTRVAAAPSIYSPGRQRGQFHGEGRSAAFARARGGQGAAVQVHQRIPVAILWDCGLLVCWLEGLFKQTL